MKKKLSNYIKQFYFTQILFFGALLSAIMSTASGAILAPATLIAENVIKPFYKNISEKTRLKSIRISVIAVALVSLALASSQGSIFDLVSGAYSITLVTAFVPLVMGLYTRKANSLGALLAIIFGGFSWILVGNYVSDPLIPPALIGLALSFTGMLIGIFAENYILSKLSKILR